MECVWGEEDDTSTGSGEEEEEEEEEELLRRFKRARNLKERRAVFSLRGAGFFAFLSSFSMCFLAISTWSFVGTEKAFAVPIAPKYFGLTVSGNSREVDEETCPKSPYRSKLR